MAQLADEIVGREGELRSFDAALGELERGRPAALEVEGEPGIGKTGCWPSSAGSPTSAASWC